MHASFRATARSRSTNAHPRDGRGAVPPLLGQREVEGLGKFLETKQTLFGTFHRDIKGRLFELQKFKVVGPTLRIAHCQDALVRNLQREIQDLKKELEQARRSRFVGWNFLGQVLASHTQTRWSFIVPCHLGGNLSWQGRF